MNTSKLSRSITRYSVGILLVLIVINAFGGGYYLMSGAENVPLDWLVGSPFKNYFYPGLFLFVVVGGSALISAIAVFQDSPLGPKAAFISALILIIWLFIQLAIIGYVSWMQPLTAGVALVILLFIWKLSKYGN